jgi:cytochrome c-type biogenesis protein CcmH
MKRPIVLFFLGLLVMLAACVPAVTAVPTPAATLSPSAITDDQVNAVAHQLYCPICQNISLDVCPTTACANWRQLIRQELAAGWSNQQIKDYFASQYGSQVLPEPPLQGFNWLAYLLPLLVFLLVLFVGWRVIRRLRRRSASAAPLQPTIQNDPYVARLEEELRQRSRKE